MDVQLVGLCGGSACAAWLAGFAATGASPSRVRTASASQTKALDEVLRGLQVYQVLRTSSEREKRRSACLKEMPQMLDVITLGLHSGLSFDASLELYCERCEGELSSALYEALVSWRMGACGRGDALQSLADDLGVVALRRFADVVLQALEFGSPLAQTLEAQADAIREEQRSQLEEEIERVPVRMMLPLGVLIVPAMLLSILGPLLGGALGMG